MKFAETCNEIFDRATATYHIADRVDAPYQNPYPKGSIEAILFDKNWIDVNQWHMEDIIRDPDIKPEDAVKIKRRIDASNQERTDMVEDIDTWFREKYKDVKPLEGATINTESPAWAIDRLSILAVKIYHMRAEAEREDLQNDGSQRQGRGDPGQRVFPADIKTGLLFHGFPLFLGNL